MSVEVQAVTKRFGGFTALDRVDLEVRPGELLGLLGPSGSGKTTLLRTIGGLEVPDAGRIILHGRDVTRRPPAERGIGFVFQHYALFRHMTVFDNVAFGLKVRPRNRRPDSASIRKKVLELLSLVQLDGLENRLPAQLSGGQRQRVALARALAIEPEVLLLDEPFGALDARVRKDLRRWIRRLHREIHVTSIFVTHDQDEALEVADRVVVMKDGRIEQAGSPEDVYDRPANPFVCNFIGRAISLDAQITRGSLDLGGRQFPLPDNVPAREGAAILFARPEDISLSLEPNGCPGIPALVRDVNHAGPNLYLELERRENGARFQLEMSTDKKFPLAPGILIHVNLHRYHVFPRTDAS